MKKLVLCILTLFILFCGTNALAVSFDFLDVDNEEIQAFKLIIEDAGDGTTSITVNNLSASDPVAISDIYFYIPDDLSVTFDEESSDTKKVKFEEDDTSGDPIELGYLASYSFFYKKTGNNKYRVDAGESMSFIVGSAFGDLDAVKVAIAVEKTDSNGGDPKIIYLASNTAPVPEPATMLLLGAGLIGIAGMGRRKLFKKK